MKGKALGLRTPTAIQKQEQYAGYPVDIDERALGA